MGKIELYRQGYGRMAHDSLNFSLGAMKRFSRLRGPSPFQMGVRTVDGCVCYSCIQAIQPTSFRPSKIQELFMPGSFEQE